MKAILVIDVDDINRFHADVYKEDDKGNGELVMSYCPLKPMPHEKKTDILNYAGLPEQYRKEGWNDCINTILGE